MASSAFLIHDPSNTFSAPTHPDVFLISEERGYSIQAVRELRTWGMSKPFNRAHKLVLIKETERLGIPAQNALLKNRRGATGRYLFYPHHP